MTEPHDPLEDTQEIAEGEPFEDASGKKTNVYPFPGLTFRVTAESVIRNALSQIDKIEECVIVFRLRGKPGLLMNYSTDTGAVDLAVAGLTLTNLAQQRMGLVPPQDMFTTPPETPAP